MRILLFATTLLVIGLQAVSDEPRKTPGMFDPQYGVYLGRLKNPDGAIDGDVYVVNETAIQIIDFNFNGNASDVYFWLDKSENPTPEGVKIPTFEFGITPLGSYAKADRVVLLLPGFHKVHQFSSLSLYRLSNQKNYASVKIPADISIPVPEFLTGELKGSRYSVGSGPILVVDKRTIKVFGFTFDGDKAPDGYFFVGRGPTVDYAAGVKVPIRGRDTADAVTAMNEGYRGGNDIILDLPEDYDIEHIDWLSVYCYKFHVDFGHLAIANISSNVPPYVPPQKRFDEIFNIADAWKVTSLLGNDQRRNFTFQLGPPGGPQGYQAITRSRPAKNVWYVNGYIAELYLKKGITYTFIVEGGNDQSSSFYFNPLYISDDQFGGYGKLSNEEKEKVNVFSSERPGSHAGRLCVWEIEGAQQVPENIGFADFKKLLRLHCESDKKPAVFTFTPTAEMPSTLYFNSFSSYDMGWKIHIVNEMPTNIRDIIEEPFRYEEWIRLQAASSNTLTPTSSSSITVVSVLVLLISLLLFWN